MVCCCVAITVFLSTLSLRRATRNRHIINTRTKNFYPRSPCGERLHYDNYNLHCVEISIHALLAESDGPWPARLASRFNFYPRSPCGERHNLTQGVFNLFTFLSTLSLRRATTTIPDFIRYIGNFYPRSPCGERHNLNLPSSPIDKFLSTLSLRRATAKVHKTVGHFCAYETNFMGIASSC